jgi:hypothetical protein
MTLPRILAIVPLAAIVGCGSSGPEPRAANSEAVEAAVPNAEQIAEGDERPPLECEGPPITPTFDWPPNLRADVRSLEVIELRDSREGDPANQVVETRHRLHIDSHEDGLRMAFEADGEGRPRLDGFLLEYGGQRPDMILSPEDGSIRALEGLDAMRAAHAEVTREADINSREGAEILARFEPNVLLEEVRGWWRLALSGWAGRTIACEETIKTDGEMAVWALGGSQVPMAYEWRYLGSEPCEEESGRGGQTCAELVVVGRADPAETRRLHEERIRAVGGPRASGLKVQRAELVRLVQVRLEPEGMLLHGIRAEEHIGSAFELPDGEVAGRRQSEGHAILFRYGTQAVPSPDESRDPGGPEPDEAR